MGVAILGKPREYLPGRYAQALLDAQFACHELGLKFELRCASCGIAYGNEETMREGERVVYYAIRCECKDRIYDVKVL
jgi:hypothetical protein